LTPDLFRYAGKFLPTYKHRRKGLKVSFGKSFFDQIIEAPIGASINRRPSRPNACAIPRRHVAGQFRARSLIEANPGLKEIQIGGGLGRYDRCHARHVPVISAVDSLPGFFLATGFSGHGFGLGPAAGKLAAMS